MRLAHQKKFFTNKITNKTNQTLNAIIYFTTFRKLIAFFVIAVLYSNSSNAKCLVSTDSCAYYLCKMQNEPCVHDHYIKNFGYPVCQKYLTAKNIPSKHLRMWLPEVRLCLQNAIQSFTCKSNFDAIAFESHIQCFIETGYCNLSNQDKAWVIDTAGWRLFAPKSLLVGLRIESACFTQTQML